MHSVFLPHNLYAKEDWGFCPAEANKNIASVHGIYCTQINTTNVSTSTLNFTSGG